MELWAESQRAYQAYRATDAELRAAVAERDRLAWQVAAHSPARPAAVAPAPPAGEETPPTAPETSTRTVQNVLFVLGGVLLGTAAIVFTVVAWTTYGLPARVAILASATLLALGAPVLALTRRLRATAETFAAIGLLLVMLDGYAVWYVDLGQVRSWETARYAGVVAAVTAIVAFGYGRLTRLAGPAFLALVAAQPVAMLVTAPARPSLAVISLLASTVAAVDVLVIAAVRRRSRLSAGVASGLRVLAWIGFASWIAAAGLTALGAEVATTTVAHRTEAGAAVLAASLTLLLAAWVTGVPALRSASAGLVVAAVVIAVFGIAALAWPGHSALAFAATTLAVCVAVRAALALLPTWLRAGPRWTASGVALLGLGVLALITLVSAASTIEAAYPLWSAPLAATGPYPPLLTWEAPVAVLGLAVATLVVCPRWTHGPVAVGGLVLCVLVLPGSLPLLWWTPPVLALGGAVVLLAAYLSGWRRGLVGVVCLAGAAVLAIDVVLTSAARPGLTALVFTAIVLLGLSVSVLLRRPAPNWTGGPATVNMPPDRVVGAVALSIGLLALPPAVGSALRAFEIPPWWGLRATVGAAALLVLAVAVLRRRASVVDAYLNGAFLAAVGSAVLWPLVAPLVGAEPARVYCGVSLLLLAAALAVLPRSAGWRAGVAVAAVPSAAVLAVAVLPAVLVVSIHPYGWLDAVWAGRPSGAGVYASATVRPVDAVALAIVAVAGAIVWYAIRRRARSALAGLGIAGPTAVLAAVVAAGASWPALPAVTLAVGLTLLLPVAVARSGSPPAAAGPWRSIVLGGQGIVYIGAGVAGALPMRWSTLTALGVVIVAFAVVGALGRTSGWRATGSVVAVAAAVAEASAAGLAAELPLRRVAFVVLGAGVVALFVGALVRRRPGRHAEAVATEAAASGAATVALTFAAGQRGLAAGVCAVWGIALAIRALVPGISRGVRVAFASVAGGLEVVAWWLLLADRAVSVIEAYTLPFAAVALFAGWAALRARPQLRSWVAYGPALLAGFLPTLATVLVSDGEVLRRLALGAAALVCVVLGAVRLRQAPVVVGGVVLVLVALHELALLWQRVQGWIPLAAGGAVLLFLAITYERRLRDLARIRAALHRMT